MKKVKKKDWQYLVEKIIGDIEYLKNQTQLNKSDSKSLKQIERNSKIYRRVYGILYYNVAENSKNFLAALDFVEIKALSEDIKANGWGLLSIKQYKNVVELLKSFNIFYYIKSLFSFATVLLSFVRKNI